MFIKTREDAEKCIGKVVYWDQYFFDEHDVSVQVITHEGVLSEVENGLVLISGRNFQRQELDNFRDTNNIKEETEMSDKNLYDVRKEIQQRDSGS